MALTTVQKLQTSDLGVFVGILVIGAFGIAFTLATIFGISHFFGEPALSTAGAAFTGIISAFAGIAVGFFTYRRVLYGK